MRARDGDRSEASQEGASRVDTGESQTHWDIVTGTPGADAPGVTLQFLLVGDHWTVDESQGISVTPEVQLDDAPLPTLTVCLVWRDTCGLIVEYSFVVV